MQIYVAWVELGFELLTWNAVVQHSLRVKLINRHVNFKSSGVLFKFF